jgi:hypothetical protein
MKRICYAALPALLLCAGCFPSMLGLNEVKPPTAPAPAVQAPPPPAPVTAESVTNENANRRAEALKAELERDENQP